MIYHQERRLRVIRDYAATYNDVRLLVLDPTVSNEDKWKVVDILFDDILSSYDKIDKLDKELWLATKNFSNR